MATVDNAHIEFVNHSNETFYFYRQFINCWKCPLIKVSGIDADHNQTIRLRSYFDQYFVATKIDSDKFWSPINVNDSCNVCDPNCDKTLLMLRDKAQFRLLIDQHHHCHLNLINAGQNQWLNAGLCISVFIVTVMVLLFGHNRLQRYLENRRQNRNTDSPTFSNTQPDPPIPVRPSHRLHSIDCFRGITIMLMIFVNYGAGEYKSLQHAPWNGFNLADCVFPFFIYVMGLSIAISFKSVASIDDSKYGILTKILKRSLKLFILGIIVNSIGAADIKTIRIPGVLQRFAVSYGIVAVVQMITADLIKISFMPRCLNCIKLWPQYALSLIMILIYSYFTFFWNFSLNCPRGYVGPGGLANNISHPYCVGGAAHRIDEIIFTKDHCYRNYFGGIIYDQKLFGLWHDPEGLLGTTTSIVLTVIGLQAGNTVKHNVQPWARFRRLINLIVLLVIATCVSVFALHIPINKNLWSLSFVLLNGSLATIVFTMLYYLIDYRKIWSNGVPFNYPGQNSIGLYLGHEITSDMLPFKLAYSYDSHVGYLAQNIFAVSIWLVISIWMAKNKIFIKV